MATSDSPSYQELQGRIDYLEGELEKLSLSTTASNEEEVFATFIEELPAMAHSIDDVGNIIYVSKLWLKKMGYERAEVVGRKSTTLLSEKSQLAARDIYLPQFLAKGYIENVPYEFVKKDGRIINVLLSAIGLLDTKGNFHHSLAVITDISDRVQAEQRLQKSEEKYRTLVELAQEGIWVIDKEGRTTFVNPAMAKMLGYAEEEMEGRHLFNFMDAKGQELAAENLKRRKDGIQEQHGFEFIRKDGSRIFTTIETAPIYDSEGNYDGAIAGILDLTKRRKAELEQRRLQVKLAQSQKMESIGNLAGGIAHDFNNILASMIGFTELAISDAAPGSELEDNLHEVLAGGNRAKELIKQILAFARQSDEVTKPVSMSSMAGEVLNLLRSTIPASIDIRTNIFSSSLVLANGIQLHQTFINLITNAAHAMRESGGVLEVEVKDVVIDIGQQWERLNLEQGEYVQVKVSDTGTGIDPDIIDQVFDPYFTTKDHGEGSGMGLAVVNGIIENYGGRIIAESTPGEITTFTFYLPASKKVGQSNSSYKERELPIGSEHVLFVDDEPPLARMSAKALERLGYSVETRTSSTEALELFRSRPQDFDLVIADMTMPHLTGDKLAIALKEIREDIPVIICTGYSSKLSKERADRLGIQAIAYKPIAKADLAELIRKVLDRKMEQ